MSQETIEVDLALTSSKEVSQLLVVDSSRASISAGDVSQSSQISPHRKKQMMKIPIVVFPSQDFKDIREHTVNRTPVIPRTPGTPRSLRQTRQLPSTETPVNGQGNEVNTSKSIGHGRLTNTPTKQTKGRKAKTDPARAELEAYSKEFLKELSQNVFKNRFGEETRLEWSNRLTRTAGKAHYSRHLDGSEESRIELSSKVVDRKDRIRNTLSHELCHLAAWRFDGNRDGGHGVEWSRWADKVMKCYPHIKITRTHTYELDYPFNWQCTSCGKKYGRWSKSISTADMVCACEGELMFISSNASRKITGREESSRRQANPSPRRKPRPDTCIIDLTCDTEQDVEVLTLGVDNIDLTKTG